MPPKQLHMLIKPASGSCNMRCAYCFYASLSGGGAPAGRLMDGRTVSAVIDRALETGAEHVCFSFQGGEPTLAGLDFFRAFTAEAEEKNRRGAALSYAIQTNGLCVDEAWVDFLRQKDFLVGISLDGTREVHDALRPDAAGRGTYGRVLSAARALMAAGVQTNALCVVSALVARHGAACYNALKRAGFCHVQFIPCVEPFEGFWGAGRHALTAEAYLGFLRAVFPLWCADLRAGRYVSVRYFDNLVHMAAGRPPEACGMLGFCPGQLIVESDGEVYPCDFYVLPELSCGNVHTHSIEQLVHAPARTEFVRASRAPHTDCLTCPVSALCRGGCRRDRQSDPAQVPGKNRYCEAYRAFLAEAAPHLADIAAHMR